MQRVTISLDEGLAKAFDQMMTSLGYHSRSEAMRDLVREAVGEARACEGHCIASLSYVFNHHIRTLGQRLTELHHVHHNLIVTTSRVFLDHDSCLETVILRGEVAEVTFYADMIQAERGVSYAKINLISVACDPRQHLSPALG